MNATPDNNLTRKRWFVPDLTSPAPDDAGLARIDAPSVSTANKIDVMHAATKRVGTFNLISQSQRQRARCAVELPSHSENHRRNMSMDFAGPY